MAASSGWWTRLKTQAGFEEPEPEPQTLLSQINEATTLNRTQVGKPMFTRCSLGCLSQALSLKQCCWHILGKPLPACQAQWATEMFAQRVYGFGASIILTIVFFSLVSKTST